MTTTKKKTTPTVAGERAGRLLAKRPTIKRLATAVDTVGLREYLRLSIAWLDQYRDYTALADRSAFMQAAARVVSEKTGIAFRLP